MREVLDFEARCVDYDITQHAISVHCPLTRFLAGIYLELSRSSISLDSPDLRPVRASAFCALHTALCASIRRTIVAFILDPLPRISREIPNRELSLCGKMINEALNLYSICSEVVSKWRTRCDSFFLALNASRVAGARMALCCCSR